MQGFMSHDKGMQTALLQAYTPPTNNSEDYLR